MGFFKKAKKKFKKTIKRAVGGTKQAGKDLTKGNIGKAVANAGDAGTAVSLSFDPGILTPLTEKTNEKIAKPVLGLERKKSGGFQDIESFKKPPPLVFDPSIAEAAADLATRKRQERRKFKGGTILTNRQQLGSPLAGVGLSRPKLGGIT